MLRGLRPLRCGLRERRSAGLPDPHPPLPLLVEVRRLAWPFVPSLAPRSLLGLSWRLDTSRRSVLTLRDRLLRPTLRLRARWSLAGERVLRCAGERCLGDAERLGRLGDVDLRRLLAGLRERLLYHA